jgi:phosphate transport system permease protein
MAYIGTLIISVLACVGVYYMIVLKINKLKVSRVKVGHILSKDNSNNLTKYYTYSAFFYSFISSVIISLVLFILLPKVGLSIKKILIEKKIAFLLIFFLSSCLFYYLLKPSFRARENFEAILKSIFIIASAVAVSITVLIFISVLYESIKFFDRSSFVDFFFGLEWSPQTAMRSDQAGGSGKFGILPVFTGTFLITIIAMLVATPIGLMSAIYLSQYSSKKFRNIVKPILEILAGIPTVVYGYFAAVTMGPSIRNFFAIQGIEVSSESALSAGLVMGIMIIPFIMSLSDDVMNAVPKSLSDASLGLGSTKSETIKKIIIPSALPGIMSAFLLAVSRAIGETMIVTMAAGLIAKLTLNPLESVTTVTAQIVKLLVGDQEFDSAKTLAAFALSLTLFLVTLVLNIIALVIVKKYREKYE